MSTPNSILTVLRRFPDGLWIRELARRVGCSPATVCNYIYGYTDAGGNFRVGVLKDDVEVEKLGGGALTVVKIK